MMNETELNDTATPTATHTELEPVKRKQYISKVYLDNIQPISIATTTSTATSKPTEINPLKRRRYTTTNFLLNKNESNDTPTATETGPVKKGNCTTTVFYKDLGLPSTTRHTNQETHSIQPTVKASRLQISQNKETSHLTIKYRSVKVSSKAQNSSDSSGPSSGITLSPKEKAIPSQLVKKRRVLPAANGSFPKVLKSSESSGSDSGITLSFKEKAIPSQVVKKRRVFPTPNGSSSKVQQSSESIGSDSGIILSPEQKAIHDMVVEGKKNVFFTGAAGTGKSILLKAIIRSLHAKYPANTVAVTAPTGIAAIHIGGVTINRFAGVGKGDDSTESYIKKIRATNEKLEMWLETNVLIIDEVSMVSGQFLDMLETIARTLRHNNKPFGGIQTIFTGDFYQLPPVNSRTLAFEAKCWRRLVDESKFLTVPFRQKDMRFATMLNELRLGKLSPETKRQFQQLKRKPKVTIDIEPTELYAMRKQVQTANDKRLEALEGPERSYQSTDTGDYNLLSKCMAERTLKLRVGAQVMLIKNLATDLVNGSIGIVTGFTAPNASKEIYPIVQFAGGYTRVMFEETWDYSAGGRVIASRRQVPLILAWAMSIHKSQGMTIEYVKVDLKGIFEAGQAYTALSRATTLEKLQVLNFQEKAIKTEPRVLAFYRSFLAK